MSMSKKPNIVFIFGDEWRQQATGYAGDTNCRTPVLDALAGESVNFVNAVSGCSVCCPYRASLVTGQYPLTHGVFINDVELSPDCYSVANAFNDGGYTTGYIGKWHLYGSPDGAYGRRRAVVPREYQLGFDYWKGFECCHDYNNSPYFFNDDPTQRMWEGYDAFSQSRDAADYIQQHADGESPFMLMLSWGPPHFPLDSAPPEYRKLYEDAEIELQPNVPEEHRAQAVSRLRGYYAHIAALDDCLKIVLDSIRDAGAEDNTIVVFTADHGDMMQSQGLNTKLFPFDESIRVPFLVRHPGLGGDGQKEVSVPIDSPDIMPTLLGLAGLPVPASVEGTDWSSLIMGDGSPTGDEAALLIMASEFTELCRNGMRAYRGLRTDRYTYVRDSDGPWLLFDNQTDPYQMRSLIDKPEAKELQEQMESRLQARLDAMGDEFLDGPAYLEQAGFLHYREVQNIATSREWVSPWCQNQKLPGA